MPFIPEVHQIADELTSNWTNKLRNALISKRFIKNTHLWTNGPRTLAKLKKDHSVETINHVLDWYCQHVGEEFVPRAVTASIFVERFADIQKAMTRGDDYEHETFDQDVLVQSERLISQMLWPVEIRVISVMASIIQRTKNNWRIFAKRLSCQSLDVDLSLIDPTPFITKIRNTHPEFVYEWMQFQQARIGRMQHYFGSVSDIAFHPNSQIFKASFWRLWAIEWCGKAERYDRLLGKVIAEI